MCDKIAPRRGRSSEAEGSKSSNTMDEEQMKLLVTGLASGFGETLKEILAPIVNAAAAVSNATCTTNRGGWWLRTSMVSLEQHWCVPSSAM